MHKSQMQVREFHRLFKYPTSPNEPRFRQPDLRANLIAEEAIETVIALVGSGRAQTIIQHHLHNELQKAAREGRTEPSLKLAIDGLCDLKYVTDGSFEDIGIDGEPFFDEVHRSNMEKVGGPIDENGKQLKPPGWKEPDIEGVLANTSPPVRESCGCDGALDLGCYNCTSEWRCPICCFPLGSIRGHKFCAHCAKQKLTADEWRKVAFTGRFTDEQLERFGLVTKLEVQP